MHLRPANPNDAESVFRIFLRARAEAMPWLNLAHTPGETRWWIEHVMLVETTAWVAVDSVDRILGFAAIHGGWLEHLYIAPECQGMGVGRALLDHAKRLRPDGLTLYVFTRNERARRFYKSAGFVKIAESDGATNEEREPDCTYRWCANGTPAYDASDDGGRVQ